MADANEVRLYLKVIINKEKTKVLFAEAGSDFADMLLSFMRLPLGKIVKVLEKRYGNNAPTIGSLTTLYNSLKKADMVNLWTERGKQVLNNPGSRKYFRNLKVSVDYNMPTKYRLGETYKAIFTRNSASFVISDDLRMVPNMTESIMETLGIDVTDMQGAEIRNVTLGLKEVIDLLKGSLTSNAPLSDLILNTRQTKRTRIVFESGILSHPAVEDATCNSKKMILKIMFQKSTNKLLFAQAKDDFVDFLFSMLEVWLGKVSRFLGGNSCVTSIDNLNWSLAYHIEHVRFSKCRFTMPEVVYNMCSLRSFLLQSNANSITSQHVETQIYVEGSGKYMVTDDLTVTRLSVSSMLSLLDRMKISVSDIQEVETQIGFQEALNILKASLTSTCALTDGLIISKQKKQPIQIQKILIQRRQDKELEEKKGP